MLGLDSQQLQSLFVQYLLLEFNLVDQSVSLLFQVHLVTVLLMQVVVTDDSLSFFPEKFSGDQYV